jgi:hypothetical protein
VEGVVADMLDPAKTVVQLETTDNNFTLTILKDTQWGAGAGLSGEFIRLHMDKADIPALAGKLSSSGAGILSIQPRHSLEDYFLSLTNAENHVEPATN